MILQIEFLIRIFIAALCGAMVGIERRKRGKGAGIRTHMVVSLASALMMIVSANVGGEPTRIAAQVVSGIGFLGAGMIYFNKGAINGLTTAAGIWATAGIGLAIGAGLYFIGIVTAVMMVAFQILLHKNLSFLGIVTYDEQIKFEVENDEEIILFIQKKLTENSIHIDSVSYKKKENDIAEISMLVSVPQNFDLNELIGMARENDGIKSITTNFE